MAKYGSPALTITIEDNSSTAQDLTEYIDEIGDVSIEAMIQEGHTFGDDWVKQLFTGVKNGGEVTVGGFYDDTADGPDAVLGGANIGDTREVVITWGGTKTSTFNAVIKSYTRSPSRGELTRFSCVLAVTDDIADV